MDLNLLLPLIPALPLAAALLTPIVGAAKREMAHWPAIVGIVGSLICSALVFWQVMELQGAAEAQADGYAHTVDLWNWATIEGALSAAALPQDVQPTRDGWLDFAIDITLRADALTAVMLVVVTFVAALVAIYSAGYMRGDRGYWRFFTYVSLFVFSMTMLVLSSNFLLLYVFWEGVGVCSYLLIGFWYEKPSAAAAGMKAFLVNRVGDLGFALGLFLIWTTYGTLNFHDTFTQVDGAAELATAGVLGQARLSGQVVFATGGTALAICLLLLTGACGKSAQFPLHVWLPDAMEGPTPVSALIHAATMVTAGVYMIARCAPLFWASPEAQLVVATIGMITALLAALIALTQFDLKRVLAYSTVSQLGFMFIALGAGTLAGTTAAMFHLFTHAFFKALLFLGAGSVMHAMGNVIDVRHFSGLRKVMPITHATFAIGCLALAGIVPFAGFFSKDAILLTVLVRAEEIEHELAVAPPSAVRLAAHPGHDSPVRDPLFPGYSETFLARATTAYRAIFWLATLTAFLTAFYTFRAFFLTFYGPRRIPPQAGHHAHESPPTMWVPLAVLAVCSAVVGAAAYFGGFESFLEHTPSLKFGAVERAEDHTELHKFVAGLSTGVAILGVALAAFLYLGDRREIEAIAAGMQLQRLGNLRDKLRSDRLRRPAWLRTTAGMAGAVGLAWLVWLLGGAVWFLLLLIILPLLLLRSFAPYRLSERKFYFDEIYDALIVRPLRLAARGAAWFDRRVVDGLVDFVGRIPPALGALARPMQMGLVQFYALAMALGLLAMVAATFWMFDQ